MMKDTLGNGFNQKKLPNYAKSKIKNNNIAEELMSAIITTLPNSDIRYLKKRRVPDMTHKVPISYYQERLMREIFMELDYGENERGYIYLYMYMHIYLHLCIVSISAYTFL